MQRVIRCFAVLAGLLVLAGCASTAEPIWATDGEVSRAVYVHDGPPKLTLYTVINNDNGFGAHSALMVNASQRVIFDPAGTWYHPKLPERNDVHFGMSDAVVDFYIDYHTRVTYRTVIQELVITPEVAQLVMNRMMAHGAVPKVLCSRSITSILSAVPGFESIQDTYYPKRLSAAFGEIPGVTREVVYDDDPDDNSGVILAPPVLLRPAA